MSFSITEHINTRHVDTILHRPILTENSATFLLYNLSAQLTGWQKYSPLLPHLSANKTDGRYYTYRVPHLIALFGLESYTSSTQRVFVTEGIFDAVRLTKYGECALALLTNSPNSSMLNFLYCLPNQITAICDNDIGGRALSLRMKKITNSIITPPSKDLGDASETFIQDIINS